MHPEPGEVVFVDSNDVVNARRWCWRQSARSATRPSTVDALFVIEGHHDSAGADITPALGDLRALLASYQPDSKPESYELSAGQPTVERSTCCQRRLTSERDKILSVTGVVELDPERS